MLHSVMTCIDHCHIPGCCINSLVMADITCYQRLCACMDGFFDHTSASSRTKCHFLLPYPSVFPIHQNKRKIKSLLYFFCQCFYSQLFRQVSCFPIPYATEFPFISISPIASNGSVSFKERRSAARSAIQPGAASKLVCMA